MIYKTAPQSKQKRAKPRMPEYEEQKAVMEWVGIMSIRYPELELAYHVPNGGYRSMSEAKRFKAEGVKSGVPDLVFPVARGGYHGLYIELKAFGGKPTDNQKRWIEQLKAQGYAAMVCVGAESAIKAIAEYLQRRT